MEATENDALEVVELYKYTLASVPPPGIPTHLSADTGKLTTKKVGINCSKISICTFEEIVNICLIFYITISFFTGKCLHLFISTSGRM